ncbi:DUF2271 domain-containing protein [Aquimarina hainanensis]|uniref:DUF2271 domain-containing protein n=1 Tax=Aquimarina hainanensis TaxID=1578017 RepID=A0ABW5NDJ1_9FLAO|nr:DUF2271 domain-containing protein [Aquimarina sp. TRL1]QKX06586.1 DUF2271 domain-containing protein [Aquimarina sp. TRL1]
MKNKYIVLTGLIAFFMVAASFTAYKSTATKKYKCMIQMINYTGEKAYVVTSLMTPDGKYEKTLNVLGDDEEWYSDLPKWWSFSNGINEDIDAITGATIGNGERHISILEIDEEKIDAGYTIRFETAVENQEYYSKDVEIPLQSSTIRNKVNGSGYIRYVRMIPN